MSEGKYPLVLWGAEAASKGWAATMRIMCAEFGYEMPEKAFVLAIQGWHEGARWAQRAATAAGAVGTTTGSTPANCRA